MRKHPMIIALTVAGIIAGTHAGIAAINSEGTETMAEAVVTPTEAQVPAGTMEGTMQAEASVPADTVEAATQADASLFTPAEPAGAKAGDQMNEKIVRVPFTNMHLRMSSTTFPSNSQEFADPLPATIAYLDRKNANIVLTGAPGSVFPSSALEYSEPLPATVAYVERIEAQRLASIRPASTNIAVNTPQQLAAVD